MKKIYTFIALFFISFTFSQVILERFPANQDDYEGGNEGFSLIFMKLLS